MSAPRAIPRARRPHETRRDRKSTRLNSSHVKISYAVFCLKKKKVELRLQLCDQLLLLSRGVGEDLASGLRDVHVARDRQHVALLLHATVRARVAVRHCGAY